ncbi:MAG: cell division FtsA domain-containing protein [Eubacteriales bacterium]|jgi:cell division protein FtsA|nr:cell division FtsA domain-containing protein [Eubacteriales bacterium]MDY2982337.1 cell division FtsA domain-containing protein [Eubacteriales bacterium]
MKPAAVLDIGSSKVVCLCGSMADGDGIVVHGAGVCTYEGYRDGAFIDKQSLHNAVVEALQKAEQESRIRIRDVALTVPAAFSDLLLTDATLSLGKPRKTEAADIDRLIALSLEKCKKKPGYTLMHSTPVFFLVDGVSSTEVPEGITTDEISALISHMFVQEAYIRTVQESLDDMGVEISMCVSAQLGESVMLIPEKERVRPAVLIDVGYHQTEISVVENTALTAISTLPIGGYQFASDLSFGLDVPMDAAEQAKRRYVFSLDLQEKSEVLRTAAGSKKVSRSAISYIIEARATELAGMLRREMENMGVNLDARPAVYVSGGGLLMMRGGLDFMRKALNLPLKRDMPWTPRLSSPNYCSAFGALDFVLKANRPQEDTTASGSEEKLGSLLKKIKEFFMK